MKYATWLTAVCCSAIASSLSGEDVTSPAIPNSSTDEHYEQLWKPDFEIAKAARLRLALVSQGDSAAAADARIALEKYMNQCNKTLLRLGNEKERIASSESSAKIEFGGRISTDDVKCLFFIDELIYLAINAKHFDDECLEIVATLPKLQILDISDSAVSGSGLSKARLPCLGILQLQNCPVTDQGICSLNLPSLVSIDLRSTKVTDRVIAEAKFTNIRSLKIGGTSISAAGFKNLHRFSRLEEIDCGFVSFSDELFSQIENRRVAITRIRVRCKESELENARIARSKCPQSCKFEIKLID